MGRNTGGMSGADIGFSFMRGAEMVGQGLQRSQQLEANNMEMEEEKGVRAAYEQIANTVGQNGDIGALEASPLMNTRHGVMAAGRFFNDRANTETSRLRMLKDMSAGDGMFYQDFFRPKAFAAQEAFQAGDMARFGAIANEISVSAPLPYQVVPMQDGNFRVRFRSSTQGDWVDTDQTMTAQDVMGEIGGILGGEQQVLAGIDGQVHRVNPRYLAAAARYRMGTIVGNATAMSDPKQWIPLIKNGRLVYAIPQNRHDDYTATPAYRVLDEQGGKSYMVGSMQELLKLGFTRADVKAQSDKLMGRGGTGKGNPDEKMGPSAGRPHIMMLNSGYIWDKDQKWYYKAGFDADGKQQADYSQPASSELWDDIARMAGGGTGAGTDGIMPGKPAGADALGIRGKTGGQGNTSHGGVMGAGTGDTGGVAQGIGGVAAEGKRLQLPSAPAVDWDSMSPEEYAKHRVPQMERGKDFFNYGRGTGQLSDEDYSR